MSDVSPGPVSGDASSTDEIIENARRPVVVARHKDAVLALEKELNTRDLIAEPQEGEGIDMLKRIAAQGGNPDHLLRDAVTEQLCIIRDRENATDSRIKAVLVDIYSHAKHLVEARHRQGLALFDLRTIAARDLPRLWQTEPIEFGKAGFHEQLIIPQTQFESRLRVVLRFNKGRNGDKTWHEASGEPRLSRQMEAPLLDLPEDERKKAREELVAHTIRSYFYRKVFRRYFDRDTLDPSEIEAHPTILDWLVSSSTNGSTRARSTRATASASRAWAPGSAYRSWPRTATRPCRSTMRSWSRP